MMPKSFQSIVLIVCMCSHTKSCPTLCNPMDYSPLGFSIMGFFRQEYWSQLPCPSLGDISNPGIEPRLFCLLHWQMGSLPLIPPKDRVQASFTFLLTHSSDILLRDFYVSKMRLEEVEMELFVSSQPLIIVLKVYQF